MPLKSHMYLRVYHQHFQLAALKIALQQLQENAEKVVRLFI